MIDELEHVSGRSVSRETLERLERFAALLADENTRQNLISRSTLASVWQRHLLDSGQLLRHAPRGVTWADIGSGAGLPGLIIALLSGDEVSLIEPRRLRTDFLHRCVGALKLDKVKVYCSKAERIVGSFDVITARAVASVPKIFAMTLHLSHPDTRWILPRGRSGAKELAEATRTWQGRFRTEPSMTDGDAVILVAEGVRPRGGTSR